MDTGSTSQTKNESEGQTGCEACIKKDRTITDMYEALGKIAEGKGRYSRDPLTHCSNTVEDMKALAVEALANSPKHSACDDMYEALKLTRDNLQTLSDAAIHYKKTFHALLEILNQAIAKAKGK